MIKIKTEEREPEESGPGVTGRSLRNENLLSLKNTDFNRSLRSKVIKVRWTKASTELRTYFSYINGYNDPFVNEGCVWTLDQFYYLFPFDGRRLIPDPHLIRRLNANIFDFLYQ